MSDDVQSRWENLAGRYGLAGQPEWRKLLNHFDLSEGFALVVLLTVEADGAALCRHELGQHLHARGQQLIAIELPTPDALRQLPGHFLDTPLSPGDACLWVAAVEPDYSKTYAEWRDAWQQTLARLNAFRNPIRDKFPLTLVFAGAPWLQGVMRETAPDLWSVRTFVTRIEPLPQISPQSPTAQTTILPSSGDTGGGQTTTLATSDDTGGGDPLFALEAADKLRGVPGKELALANLLHRAGDGFANLQDWRSAEKAYSESLELKNRYHAPPPSLLDTLVNLGGACITVGQIQPAITLFEQARQIGRQIGDRLVEAAMLGNLGSAYLDLGDARTATKLSNESLTIARELRNRKFEGNALGILGNACLNSSDVRKAIAYFEQELAIAREVRNQDSECSAVGNLGRAYASLGDFQKAVEFLEQAIALARKIHNYRFENILLSNLGIAYRGLGQTQKAIECYERALAKGRQISNKRMQNGILGNLGNAYRALGNTHKAIEYYEQSLLSARASGCRFGESANLANLGIAYQDLGQRRKGLEFFEQALVIAREVGDRRLEAGTLWNTAVVLEQMNDLTQAIQRAEAALRIFQAIEDPNAAKVLEQLATWRGQK
jgi:tetratricopeptide (TPR) repeat protein